MADGILAVTVIKDGVVHSMKLFDDAKQAEADFKKQARRNDPAWADLSKNEISDVLDDGFYEFTNGSICVTWPELASPRLVPME